MYSKIHKKESGPSAAAQQSNAKVSRKSKSTIGAIQTKVNIGKPNDKFEKEADHVADKVVQKQDDSLGTAQTQIDPVSKLQRSEEEAQTKVQPQEEEEAAQTKIQRQEEEEAAQTKVQRQEEEEAAQTKVQRQEEEEAAQAKGEEEEAQTKVQRQEEEEAAQAKGEEEEAQTKVQRQEEEEAAQAKSEKDIDKEKAQKEKEIAEAKKKKADEEKEVADKKLQRQEEEVQAKSTESPFIVNDFEKRLEQSKASGEQMPEQLLKEMNARFGVDFSDVKIHTDPIADQMARDIKALAFTVGNHIYFKEGQFNPETIDGKHLLAHELTHTLQQEAISQHQASDDKKAKAGLASAIPGLMKTDDEDDEEDEE